MTDNLPAEYATIREALNKLESYVTATAYVIPAGKAFHIADAALDRLAAREVPAAPPAAECAARLALKTLFDSCSTTHPDWGADICEPDGNAMSQACAALATPCQQSEIARLTAEVTIGVLRAQLAQARKSTEEAQANLEEHEREQWCFNPHHEAELGRAVDALRPYARNHVNKEATDIVAAYDAKHGK